MTRLDLSASTVRTVRRCLLLAALLLVGCSQQLAGGTPQAAPTTVAPTSAPVWRDKLNGRWISENADHAEWTVDLIAGTLHSTVRNSPPTAATIVFDHEKDKTVFVRFSGNGQNSAQLSEFRFLNDDLVVREQGGKRVDIWRRRK